MSSRPYTRVTTLVIGLMSVGSSLADVLCDADGAFHRSGISPHKTCIAEQVPEFADYSNLLSKCTLKVFLTNLARKETLENELRPAYERHVEGLPWCKQPTIEFERAPYGYLQMSAWKTAAEVALQEIEPLAVVNVALCDAKLHLPAIFEANKEDHTERLGDLGIPGNAYVFGPETLKIRGIPIVGLPAPGGTKGDNISLPISFGAGLEGGELILGHTGLRDTMHMLPPCPGHGPIEDPEAESRARQQEKATDDKLSEFDGQVMYAYIPAQASMSLAFNAIMRLAALTYLTETDQEELAELIDSISAVVPLQRIYADDRIVFLAGEAGPVFATLGAERDWYDKPYRVIVAYAHDPGIEVTE